MRDDVRQEVQTISALDELETYHLSSVLTWIDSGAELCRTAKPATPAKHLVSYFVLIDANSLLLVDHRRAGLWLPTGGHVEPGEHPRQTALREAREELGITPAFLLETPLMLTCTEVREAATKRAATKHTDVSLWYVMQGEKAKGLEPDMSEFAEVRWVDVADIPYERSDPHMRRFVTKLRAVLE